MNGSHFVFFRFYQVFTTREEVVSRQQNKNVAENWSVYCIAIKGQKELFCGAKLRTYVHKYTTFKSGWYSRTRYLKHKMLCTS